MADKIINKRNDKEMDKTEMNNNSKNVGYLSNEAFKCYYGFSLFTPSFRRSTAS